VGIFAWAVRSLGVLDRSALPTLRRYGVFVDVEHEYYFAGTTVPAVIKAHGWTDDVVDFVFWVLAWNFYNTLDDYGKVWGGWGLRDTVIHREPRAFARHIAAGHTIMGRHQNQTTKEVKLKLSGCGQLVLEALGVSAIPQPHEPWAATFFEELERIFAEPANAE
jgi:hypothetical protein